MLYLSAVKYIWNYENGFQLFQNIIFFFILNLNLLPIELQKHG